MSLSLSAQTTDDQKRLNALKRKLGDSTGLGYQFNDFSKQSDEDLLEMAKTLQQNPDLVHNSTTSKDDWQRFETDLHKELDRRGRTPEGGWKAPYQDANTNKVDINKKLNEQLRSQENTKGMDQKQNGNGQGTFEKGNQTGAVQKEERPGGTQAMEAQNPAPRNRDFEKAETVTSEAPPPTTVTSVATPPEKSVARGTGETGSLGEGAKETSAASEGRSAGNLVEGEQRALGEKPGTPLGPVSEGEGVFGTLKRWGGGVMEALWGAAKVDATAEGSTRTIDHAEKKDAIQTALNTIDGEKKPLEQHLRAIGSDYNLSDVADPKKGFNTPAGRSEIDRIKGLVGPEKAADLENTLSKIQKLDADKAAIEKGRQALKDKWRAEGISDVVTSGGLGAKTIDPNDLDSIPELKKYNPDLAKKESSPTPSGLVAQNPAEQKLLAMLSDPEKRKQFLDNRTDEEILNLFRINGSLNDVLKPKSPEQSPSPQDSPSGSPNPAQVAGLDPKNLRVGDEATIRPTPQDGGIEDFANPGAGDATPSGAANPASEAASGAKDFDTSGFARGQAKEDAEASRIVQGDYAEATRLENALRAAEEQMRRAEAEAKRIAAEQQAARDRAAEQRALAEAQQRQQQAYQQWLAQKRAYDQWIANQRAVQQPVHQNAGVIMDQPH